MLKRVLTSIVGIPILIYIVSTGGLLLFFSLLIVVALGLWEYSNTINKSKDIRINSFLEIFFGILLFSIIYLLNEYTILTLVLIFMLSFVFEVFSKDRSINRVVYSIFGLLYIPMLFGLLINFQNYKFGNYIIWLVFIIAFSTDTFAYFVGVFLGKHKLCPQISPKKTIEGSIGGIVGSIIITNIFGILLYYFVGQIMTPFSYTILALFGSIFAQFGDLSASMIKRKFEVKDFGYLFPGHGGILDRFDSILFVIPIIFFYLNIFS